MDFKVEVEKHFSMAITNYQLRVLAFDQYEVILLGNGFALCLSYDREGVNVGYIEITSDHSFILHRITNFIGMNRFLPEDRQLFGSPPNTTEEQVRSSLRVIASGITHRCKDILSGEKTWLENLRRKDSTSWKGQALNNSMLALIISELSRSYRSHDLG